MSETFDVIIVGGGSAGCVIAAKLSEDPSRRVCLIEAGEHADANPETLRADGYKHAFANDRVIWERYAAPTDGAAGRRLFVGTGRGLGGSGAVNGMVYTRGAALDYEAWPTGWRWADVAPVFDELEATLLPNPRPPTAWTEAVLEAAGAAGLRRSSDLNDGDLSNVIGYEWMNQHNGERRSSYVAMLAPALARPNLTVITGALVHRVLFEGRRAVGVALADRTLSAPRVVLCAGALETPKLLLLSGIGPAAHLAAHGVPLVLDQAAVGANLHDHPNVQLFFAGRAPIDCSYPQVYGFYRANPDLPLPPEQADSCYVAWPARSAMREAMLRMLPAIALPHRLRRTGWARETVRAPVRGAFRLGAVRRAVDHLWAVVVILGKPHSRGTLRLRSADPHDEADIDPAWLSDPRDVTTMLRSVAIARKIAGGPTLRPYRSVELSPGPFGRTDASTVAWLRRNIMTTYHFAGTCRMGEDAAAPVDTRCALRGVEGVTVADASIIPETPVSALNAPSMMIGLRAAGWLSAKR